MCPFLLYHWNWSYQLHIVSRKAPVTCVKLFIEFVIDFFCFFGRCVIADFCDFLQSGFYSHKRSLICVQSVMLNLVFNSKTSLPISRSEGLPWAPIPPPIYWRFQNEAISCSPRLVKYKKKHIFEYNLSWSFG